MQRIPALLKKITEIAEQGDNNTVIDIDLMLDYTRVVYADLLEWRGRKSFVASLAGSEENPQRESPAPATETTGIAVPEEKEQVQENVNDDVIAEVTAPEEEAEEPAQDNGTEQASPVIELVFTPSKPKPAHDIRRTIGINDKFLFMSELFGNDRDAYEHALDTINMHDTYEDAAQWLQENVQAPQNNGEDNYTMESFRSTVQMFFNSK